MDLNCLFETTNYEYEYVDKMIDAGIQEKWEQFLKENSEDLNEETLDEGKILNKIRWKLALFSLRFLKETSINDFFMAYYADKEGNPTKEGTEFCKKKKSEKLNRMRELAYGLDEGIKEKVINSEAAKEAEKRGFGAFLGASASGTVAGAGNWLGNVHNANNSFLYYKTTPLISLAGIFFGFMWSSIILAASSAVTGILAFHKAGTLRRDEIIDELRKDKKDSK